MKIKQLSPIYQMNKAYLFYLKKQVFLSAVTIDFYTLIAE